jgi:hypothetical protein
MTNPHRGAVRLQAPGGALYTLRFSYDALAQLQGIFGTDYLDTVVKAAATQDVTVLARVMVIALREAHGEITPALLDAQEVTVIALGQAVTRALHLALWGPGEPDPGKQTGTLPSPEQMSSAKYFGALLNWASLRKRFGVSRPTSSASGHGDATIH